MNMKNPIKKTAGRRTFGFVTRFARVQVLGLATILGVVTLPAWAAANEQSAPTDLPEDLPAQPVGEPALPVNEQAQGVDDPIPANALRAHFETFLKSIVDAAHSLTTTAAADNANFTNDEDVDAPAPAKAQEQAPASDVKTTEAEIESIAAQIEEEKLRSARRIAELEDQLTEAREQLSTITGTDGQGFIRNWLILGPVRVDEKVSNHDEESNKELLDRSYVPQQATPKDGDSATIDDAELTWKAVRSDDYFVDLAKVAAEQELDAEQSAYLGVAYITSEEEVTGVKLSIGSDDDSVWRLNGTEVIRSYGGRGVDKDQDAAEELTLKQGVNVLTFTVLNGQGPTAAAAHFVDEDGNPIRGLKVSLTPPSAPVAQTDPTPED
jgi:hypothetical protein